MTDKELGITVTADIESAISDLQTLLDTINSIPTDTEVDIAGDAPGELEEISTDASDADAQLQALGEAASMAGAGISDIDPSSLQQTSDDASDAADNTEGATSAASGLSGVMSGLVGIGIGAWFADAVNGAGNFEDQWNQIGLVMNESDESVTQLQATWSGAMTTMEDDTGRTAGQIRNAMTVMGLVGLTTQDEVTQGFDLISAAAERTGTTTDQTTAAFKRLEAGTSISTKQLQKFGISSDMLNNYLAANGESLTDLQSNWLTMTAAQKEAVLEDMMGADQIAEANDKAKISWQEVSDQIQAAIGYLTRIAGGLILPIVVPAITALTGFLNDMADGIDNLNPVLKDLLGMLILVGGGLTTLFMILGPGLKLFELMSGPIVELMGGLLGLGEGADVAAVGMGLLDVAMGPVGWAILAITAAVLAGIYIWQTYSTQIMAVYNDLASGNWGAAAQGISNAFVYAGQQIYIFFENLPQEIAGMIGNLASTAVQMGLQFVEWLINGLSSLASALTVAINQMLAPSGDAGSKAGQSTGSKLIDGLVTWIQANGPTIVYTLEKIFILLIPLVGRVAVLIGEYLILALARAAGQAGMALINGIRNSLTSFVTMVGQSAQQAGMALLNGFIQFVSQLPSNLAFILGFAVGHIVDFAGQLPGLALQAGTNLVNGFIDFVEGLPGDLWNILMQAINHITDFGGQAGPDASTAGSNIYNGLINAITGLPGAVWNELMQIGSQIESAGSTLYNDAVNVGKSIWNGFMAGLGIHSPGLMYQSMVSELQLIHGAMNQYQGILGSSASALGNSMVSGFNSKLGNIPKLGGSGGSTISITIDAPITIQGNADSATIKNTAQQLGTSVKDVVNDIFVGAKINGINIRSNIQ
jgi:hypothetical protein